MRQDPSGSDTDEAQQEPVSKSQRKRDMHALQALGETLVELPTERLAQVPLPEALYDAIMEARQMTKHGARRRQLQYVGKLMRQVDPAPIQARIDAFRGESKAEAVRQKQLEQLRNDFLQDDAVAGDIIQRWPAADLQHLRTLRRNALKERDHNKPPHSARALFRALKALQQQALAQDDSAATPSGNDTSQEGV